MELEPQRRLLHRQHLGVGLLGSKTCYSKLRLPLHILRPYSCFQCPGTHGGCSQAHFRLPVFLIHSRLGGCPVPCLVQHVVFGLIDFGCLG